MRGRIIRSGLAVCLFATVAAGPAGAAMRAPDMAAEILRRAEEIRNPEADYAVEFTLHTVSPASAWKERTARYTMIAHGKDQALVLMRYPKQFYPGTMLIVRGTYWLLLPKADKPLQLSPQQILEGEVSYGDLARGDLLGGYESRLDGEEAIGGARCWRLELSRTGPGTHYPRIRCWIERRNHRPRRFEYYGMTGALLKTAVYTEYRRTSMGHRPARMEVTSPARPDESTTLIFADLRPIDLGRVSFTTGGLRAFRDAARDRTGADGAQAGVEEVVASLGRDGL